MALSLFIEWVVFVFAVSDLVGTALRRCVSGGAIRRMPGARLTTDRTDRQAVGHGGLAECALSTLLGLAVLWVALSVAYALGIATRGVIVGTIGAVGVTAALGQRHQLGGWARSRACFWAVIGVVALLASCVPPKVDPFDDPEYFFLIDKLLHTGAVTEYFSYHRPITLGGWTLVQALFCAGPAGTAFVASIDAVVGGALFLVCAFLLGADGLTAPGLATAAVLMVQHHQVDLGTAIVMSATGAVLIALSLCDKGQAVDFAAMTIAVAALTIRPQLGLIAVTAGAIVCLRFRRRWYLPVGLAAVLLSLWVAIFFRDTGLLPVSASPGYNPLTDAIWVTSPQPLVSQLMFFGRHHWRFAGLLAAALVVCVWQSVASTSPVDERRSGRILILFAVVTIATAVVMVVMIGGRAPDFARYYIPVVESLLYVVVVRIVVRALRYEAVAKSPWFPAAVMAGTLAVAIGISTEELGMPTGSSARICMPPLTSSERRRFGALPAGTGLTVLEMACATDSFELSRVMLGDLFFATRGDDFDIASSPEETVKWLQMEDVGRLVYLDHDTSKVTGLDYWRRRVALDPLQPEWIRREHSYIVDSLQQLRGVASRCPSVRLPLASPQGPLVVVDVESCAAGVPTRPGGSQAPGGPSEP